MHSNKDGRRVKSTSTLSWVSDKLAAGAARVNGGEFQDIEIAVLKATNHDVVPPKEKHVRTLREVISTSLNLKRVVYIIHALYERLRTPHESWLVILKTLMVFHKLMKSDGEASFKQEMVKYKQKRKLTRLLSLENFTDQSKSENWDFSAFVRVYSLYLEEKLVVFEQISFDIERDSRSDGIRFKSALSHEILMELPKLQKLLQRILCCVPEGNAMRNEVVLESMKWTMTECFKLYRTISEGVIILSDQFFQLDKIDARKGLEMYKEAINSTSQIQSFFSAMQNLTVGQQIQFPQLEAPPEDFVDQMEEYVKGATSRTITRRFPSTLSRNARGGPSPAISGEGNEIPRRQSKNSEEIEEGVKSNLLNLDINDPVISPRENNSPVVVKNHVPDPFADPVFTTPNSVNTGPVFGERSIIDEWIQPPGMRSSLPERTVSYQDHSMTPFDDFYVSGVLSHPPPSQSSGNLQTGNPFDDAELNFLPQQDSLQSPSPQKIQQSYSAGIYAGPRAMLDPFDGLNPSIQSKTSLANPGVPMRSSTSRDFANTSTPQSTFHQQDYPSFF